MSYMILGKKQDGPSLESSLYLNVSLRYLSPWDPGTLEPLVLGTPPISSSYSPPWVWFGYGVRGG